MRDTFLFAYRHFMRGVRDGAGNKLIETAAAGQCHTQLFELSRDPWEQRNLADDPIHAERVLLLRDELTSWRNDWDDTLAGHGADFWSQMEWAD